jgi:hypothetical protein
MLTGAAARVNRPMADPATRLCAPRRVGPRVTPVATGSAPAAREAQSLLTGDAHLGVGHRRSRMATHEEIADAIAGMAMFADLARPQLLGVATQFDEAFFPKGARIVRQGLTGSGFYIILEGEADVVADGEKRATVGRGDFFGEVSVLLGEPPIADVVATRPLRCIVIPGPGLEPFLLEYPKVMFRMLQASARRLRGPARRG